MQFDLKQAFPHVYWFENREARKGPNDPKTPIVADVIKS